MVLGVCTRAIRKSRARGSRVALVVVVAVLCLSLDRLALIVAMGVGPVGLVVIIPFILMVVGTILTLTPSSSGYFVQPSQPLSHQVPNEEKPWIRMPQDF